MRDRNTQKQIWANIKFKEWLERVKAKRLLNGNPAKNIGQLTKEMLKCPSVRQLEKELLRLDLKNRLEIKLDKKRLF